MILFLKKIKWYITGHLIWKSTDYWIKDQKNYGIHGDFSYVPKKRFMSAWEWWTKYSCVNSSL